MPPKPIQLPKFTTRIRRKFLTHYRYVKQKDGRWRKKPVYEVLLTKNPSPKVPKHATSQPVQQEVVGHLAKDTSLPSQSNCGMIYILFACTLRFLYTSKSIGISVCGLTGIMQRLYLSLSHHT